MSILKTLIPITLILTTACTETSVVKPEPQPVPNITTSQNSCDNVQTLNNQAHDFLQQGNYELAQQTYIGNSDT